MLLHPLLPLELLMSYRDARITNSRKNMSSLPEKIMKTISQHKIILSSVARLNEAHLFFMGDQE